MARDKSMHLAGYIPFFKNAAFWRDPAQASPMDFSAFETYVSRIEAAKFDFVFLAEGLRVREYQHQVIEMFATDRPDNLTVTAGMAAITEKIGLAITTSTTFNEPYELARQLGTLDRLSGGRVGWNVVTTNDRWHGGNFRRGGFLPYAERYDRAAEFLDACYRMWDSRGAAPDPGQFEFAGRYFNVAGRFNSLGPVAGAPVLIQAGDSAQGRDMAARYIDVIFSSHSRPEAAAAFSDDMTERLRARGRARKDLKILPMAHVVIGDTEAEARERERAQRRFTLTPGIALFLASQAWGIDLSSRDPDGPLPEFDPDPEGPLEFFAGFAVKARDAVVDNWRRIAAEKNLSLYETVLAAMPSANFVGTKRQVARAMTELFESGACDGYIMDPPVVPHGLDEFIDDVLPEIRDLGAFRDEYEGETLRDHLELSGARVGA